MFVAIFVVALALIILIHELGHFVTARMCGMKAEKFFIGFGPTLWSTQRGETEVGVKWLPLGGFVKIAGMSPYEEYDEADRDRTYFAQPGWQRAIVICAGSITHFVMAAALLFAALAFIGLPPEDEPARNEIARVVEGEPAEQAGLEPGDEIVAVDGEATPDFAALAAAIEPRRPGEQVRLTVERGDGTRQVTVTLGQHPERPDAGYLGFLPASPPREPLGAAEAAVSVVSGDRSLPRIATLSVTGIAEALSPQGLAEWFATFDEQQRSAQGPVSPVGAGQIVAALGDQGQIFGILLLLVQFNIIIGVLNMLPLPPLDGGHFAVVLVEGAVNTMRRARGVAGQYFVDPSRLTPLALLVILFFGTVFLSALYLDLVKPASQLVN
jgi:membrane-associated protease RseP (regulator of RpoE activity)